MRDSSFSVYSLLGLGFTEEAAAFAGWLGARVQQLVGSDEGPLKIMYRVDGSSDLTEETLDHWDGHRGSRPVRIGNGAADQLRLDIHGEALDSIYFADVRGIQQPSRLAKDRRSAELARRPLGPTRGGHLGDPRRAQELHLRPADERGRHGPRHPIGDDHGRPTPLERWQRERNAIYNQIMSRGWSPQRNAFVQEYDNTVLDASLLRMPTVGFISGVFGDAVLALGALVWRTSTVQSALARESNQAAAERCRRWPHSTGLR